MYPVYDDDAALLLSLTVAAKRGIQRGQHHNSFGSSPK